MRRALPTSNMKSPVEARRRRFALALGVDACEVEWRRMPRSCSRMRLLVVVDPLARRPRSDSAGVARGGPPRGGSVCIPGSEYTAQETRAGKRALGEPSSVSHGHPHAAVPGCPSGRNDMPSATHHTTQPHATRTAQHERHRQRNPPIHTTAPAHAHMGTRSGEGMPPPPVTSGGGRNGASPATPESGFASLAPPPNCSAGSGGFIKFIVYCTCTGSRRACV